MPEIGQKIVSDYLNWKDLVLFISRMLRDTTNEHKSSQYKYALFIIIGSVTGLRISDILNLKWVHLISKNRMITIYENKNKCSRNIILDEQTYRIIMLCYTKLKIKNNNSFCFTNQFDKVYSIQYINQRLKVLKNKYDVPINNFSTHTLRKTFGRHIWINSNYNEKVLPILKDILGHSTVESVKNYLGISIKDEKILNIYNVITPIKLLTTSQIKEMTKTQVKQSLVEKSICKNRAIMQELHDRLLENNPEMFHYLQQKNELEDFLIERTDAAHNALVNADDDLMFPEEIKNQVINIGLENSISEYVESLINEFPKAVAKYNKSSKQQVILQNLVKNSLPIFYNYLDTPYSESQEQLDAELLVMLESELVNI